jgi:FkbM family methyltransferase
LRLHLDFSGISDPANEPEYFKPDLVTLTRETSFVDCGAYDGDTARSFLENAPRDWAGRLAAFEPDPGTFARLAKWRDSLPAARRDRISIYRAGVGARAESVTFAEGGGWGSAVSSTGTVIDIVSLDTTVADAKPTLIKVDVEGYDPDVIEGARKIITETTPTLAVCVYHRQDHPWRIPLQIAAMNPNYRYSLRTYCLDGFDLVLYCVPRNHEGSS